MPFARRFFRNFGFIALFLAAALFGIASGVIFAFVGDLPQISALDDYRPSTITKVLGRDGTVVGEFASERRVLVTYEQIPQVLRNAIVASEDADFFKHSGIDLKAIAALGVRRVLGMQHRGGASTITQQLARNLFLERELALERANDNDLPLERKIKEWMLAIQIDKRYTKPEILTMYCNKMYFGHYAYGVEAASQLYFGKPVSDLNLDEAALIAGLLQGNVRQSPYVNMKAALSRRAYVLDRMAQQGFISAADAKAAKERPILTRGQPTAPRSIAPYFLENLRIHLEEAYGAKALYENGLTVKTGLDAGLQIAANKALDVGLRRLDKQRGYRKVTRRNVLADGKTTLESYRNPRWSVTPAEGDIVPAVVMGAEGGVMRVRVGALHGTIAKAGYDWTKRKTTDDLAKRGDLIDVKITKLDPSGQTFEASLEQTPELQGAIVAIDNHTGQILAMIGGRDFERSQFNRATQAMRQVGSLFKPFVYTTAIDAGYPANYELMDEPVSFFAGPNQPMYEPKNFDRKFIGPVSLRLALEDSRNVPTIKLMDQLGRKPVIDMARKFGVTAPLQPYLSAAIGAEEVTLMEMTSAYTAFPNQGVRMDPILALEVTDREGNVLESALPRAHDVIKADTAFIMTDLLKGVLLEGTGISKAQMARDWPLAGKTGTTDDVTDVWFVGFDPEITIGVWVGFDQKKTIGERQEGAKAALPIWADIMQTWIDRQKKVLTAPPKFERPGNIVYAMMADGKLEVFIAGTEPGGRR